VQTKSSKDDNCRTCFDAEAFKFLALRYINIVNS
jgi:hypothetical protein